MHKLPGQLTLSIYTRGGGFNGGIRLLSGEFGERPLDLSLFRGIPLQGPLPRRTRKIGTTALDAGHGWHRAVVSRFRLTKDTAATELKFTQTPQWDLFAYLFLKLLRRLIGTLWYHGHLGSID